MTVIDVVVIVATVLASAGLLWFFFGTRTAARRAETTGLTQQITVVVRGGYSPQRIEAVAGGPAADHLRPPRIRRLHKPSRVQRPQFQRFVAGVREDDRRDHP